MHRRFFIGVLLLSRFGSFLFAQQDPMQLLLSVRTKVMQTVDRLPKYMCTETIDRSRYRTNFNRHLPGCDQPSTGEFKPKLTLTMSDRLRLDVAITSTREIYSWSGANRFDDRDLLDIVNEGAISTGEFGGYLSSVFGSDAANFTYNGDIKDEKGRALVEFGFTVPKEKSRDEFGSKKYRTITGYDGTILVDPKTFDLVRLSVRTDRLPEETGVCDARTTLDYGYVQMNGNDFLLPSQALLRVDLLNGNQNENRAVYSACHEFHADSKVSFEAPAELVDSAAPVPVPVAPLDLPPGLPFRLKLAQDIDSVTAAAGDPVRAVLAGAIGDRNSAVSVPAGSAVNGRIVRIQHTYGQTSTMLLVIKLESIEFQGQARPFSARGEAPIQRFNAGSVSFTRQRVQLGSLDAAGNPGTGQIVVISPGPHHIFRRGTEMKFLTVRTR